MTRIRIAILSLLLAGSSAWAEDFKMSGDWQTASARWTDNSPLFGKATSYLARKNALTNTETGGVVDFSIGQYAFNSQPSLLHGQTTLRASIPTRTALVQKYDQKRPSQGLLNIAEGGNAILLENVGITAAGNGGAAIAYNGTGSVPAGNLFLTNVRIGTADYAHAFDYGLYLDGCSAHAGTYGIRDLRLVNVEIFSTHKAAAYFGCANEWSWIGGGAFDTAPGASRDIQIVSTDSTPSANGIITLPYARTITSTAGAFGTYEMNITVPHLQAVNFVSGKQHEISVTGKSDSVTFQGCTCSHIVINGDVDRLIISGGVLTDVSVHGNVGALLLNGGSVSRFNISGSAQSVRTSGMAMRMADSTIFGSVGAGIPMPGLRYLANGAR